MEYKKIFRSPESRNFVLDLFRILPDSVMLKIQYRIKLNRNLNLKKPKRFSEKIQWYKVNYREEKMHKCVDKYLVRKYVEEKGLKDILVHLIARYNSVQEIQWEKLPEKYVMKTTHGGGGLNVIVCKNKKEINIDEVKRKLKFKNKPVKTKTGGREWAYYGIKPGIIVEELLENSSNSKGGIDDYKFFCFNGTVQYIVVDTDRYAVHKRNFFDSKWNDLGIESDCPVANKDIPAPNNLNEMIEVAQRLSEDFPFVRVDLYNVDGQIYFGELTFYPWSGYVQFIPDSFDYKLGESMNINLC